MPEDSFGGRSSLGDLPGATLYSARVEAMGAAMIAPCARK